MKDLLKTSRVAGYLEKLYRELNQDLFNNELEMPIITIQDTPRAYGHVTVGKVWKSENHEAQYELNLGAGTLARPIEETVATLVHEMVHIFHLQNDIQDCSRGGAYHNKKFKEKAESVGLIIEHHNTYGWTITTPSDELILYIADKGWTDILIQRGSFYIPPASTGGSSAPTAAPPAPTTRKPTSTRKYQCPCCGNSVRATKVVNILCGDCQETMLPA